MWVPRSNLRVSCQDGPSAGVKRLGPRRGGYTITQAGVTVPPCLPIAYHGQANKELQAAEDPFLSRSSRLMRQKAVGDSGGPLPGGVLPCFFFAPAAKDPPLEDCTSGMGVAGL